MCLPGLPTTNTHHLLLSLGRGAFLRLCLWNVILRGQRRHVSSAEPITFLVYKYRLEELEHWPVALELREADARGELATFCCGPRKAEETRLPRKRSTRQLRREGNEASQPDSSHPGP